MCSIAWEQSAQDFRRAAHGKHTTAGWIAKIAHSQRDAWRSSAKADSSGPRESLIGSVGIQRREDQR
jgi:hypothetical protein